MVDNSCTTSRSIISRLGPEIFVQINHMLTKFCPLKVTVSGNYDTPCSIFEAPVAVLLFLSGGWIVLI